MIDSGSRDGSRRDRARGRRRRCSRSRRTSSATAARATSAPSARRGELIVLPHAGRDARCRAGSPRYREAFALDARVGAVVRPAPARARTRSPMIARELTEFFAALRARRRAPRVQRRGDPTFLSNVNAALPRAPAGSEIRFRDVPYAEDQAFGARPARAPAGRKVYHPRRGGAARARLRARRVHAPLLRRVPRAARDDRATSSRSALRSPLRDVRAAGRRRPALDARARAAAGGRARALDGALGGPPRRAQGLLRARARAPTGCRRGVQRALSLEGAADGARRRPSRRSRRRGRAHRSRAIDAVRGDRALRCARARRRCSTRCRAWPTASGCTSRS